MMVLSTLITHAAIARRSTLTAILRISVAVRRENIGDMSDDIIPRARHVHERRQARLAPGRVAPRRCATSSTSRARDEIISKASARRGRRGRCRAGKSKWYILYSLKGYGFTPVLYSRPRARRFASGAARRALTATSTTHVPVPAMVPAELTAALAAPGGRALRLRPLRSRLSHTAHRPHRKKQGPGRPRDPTGPRRRESRYCRYAIKVKAP